MVEVRLRPSSSAQVSRVAELAARCRVPLQVLLAWGQTDDLEGMSAVRAGGLIRLLLECDHLPLPADEDEGAARFAAAAGTPELKKKPKGRRSTGDWNVWAAARLGLEGPSSPCAACDGRGTVAAAPGKNETARLILGYQSQTTPSSGTLGKSLRAPNFRLLRHVADTWFDGDLNGAAEFCGELADRVGA